MDELRRMDSPRALAMLMSRPKSGVPVDMARLNADSVVFEVGARTGRLVEALRGVPGLADTMVYAIEPSQRLARRLRELRLSRCMVIEAAVVGHGDSTGTVEFCEPNGLDGWGNIVGDYATHDHTVYPVRALDINTLLRECNISGYVDWMAMDVEGAEADILRHMHPDTANRILQISVESHPAHAKPKQIAAWLEKLGFRVSHFRDSGDTFVYGWREQ